MRACEEGQAREVEDGEGFSRRGCEAAIVGDTRGRAGRVGRPGCAWNERPQMKLWHQQRISGLDRSLNFGHKTLAMARVLSPRGGFGAELSPRAILFGFKVDFIWVSLLRLSLGFVWEGFVAARGGFSAILFAAGRVRSRQFAREWQMCRRRGEGSAPNSPPGRFSLGLGWILFGCRSFDSLWVSFGRVSSLRGEGSAQFCSLRGGFGHRSLLAYGEGVVAAGRVRRRTLLQREFFLHLAKFVPRHIFFVALKCFFT